MVPKVLMRLPRLPVNANGKVDRKALPKPDAAPDAEDGETETVPITGSVLVTEADAVPVSVPPSVSVAVAVQVSVSPGSSLAATV